MLWLGMTAETVGEGKGHDAVTPPAIFPLDDAVHADRIGALFHNKYGRMAIVAIEPHGMGRVGEDDIRDRIGFPDLKNDVQVQDGAGGFAGRLQGILWP